MPSSLIDIADWIDRFGMELLDADAALDTEDAPIATPAAAIDARPMTSSVLRSGPARRSSGGELAVLLDESRWARRVPELLH